MEAFLALAIPAMVKLVQEANERNWGKVGLIVMAAVAGGTLGFITGGVDGIVTGVFEIGLAGSGLVTVAGYAGRKANPTNILTK